MKKNLLLLFSAIITLTSSSLAQRTCGSMSYLAAQKAADPSLAARMQAIENHTDDYIRKQTLSRTEATIVTIPVVFHVVYKTAAQNISDAQCIAQLAQLNLDYAKMNSDTTRIPAVFKGLAADTKIQFCLAQKDPNGNTTTGIIHKLTTTTSFSTNDGVKRSSSGGDDAWPRDSYLNLWACNLGSSLLGYAQFPGGAAATDGVVLLYSTVGSMASPTSGQPYNLGRTATHEVGHWLNMIHIWGDQNCGNDGVADTPPAQTSNYGCKTHPYNNGRCTGNTTGEMFMNYMDYVDDGCMQMFTAGQATRMQALFNSGGSRAALLNSQGCQSAVPGFVFNSTAVKNITCNSSSDTASINIGITRNGLKKKIVLTDSGAPSGTYITFEPDTIKWPGSGPQATKVILHNVDSLAYGSYNILIRGTAKDTIPGGHNDTVRTATVTFVVSQINPVVKTKMGNTRIICYTKDTVMLKSTANISAIPINYQWMVSPRGNTSFSPMPGEIDTTLIIQNPQDTSLNNYRYVLKYSTQCGIAYSDTLKLLVDSTPAILTYSPQNFKAFVCQGHNTSFSITTSSNNIKYDWQKSTNNEVSWDSIPNAHLNSYSINNANISDSNNHYRIITTNKFGCGEKDTSQSFILMVGKNPIISASSSDYNVCSGTKNITLSVTGGDSTYNWSPISMSGSSVQTVPIVTPVGSADATNNIYQVIATNKNSCKDTATVSVMTYPEPVITLSSNPYFTSILPGQTVEINASITPDTGFDLTWLEGNNPISNTTSAITLGIENLGSYSAIAYNSLSGCRDTSTNIIVSDSASIRLFVFPNPASQNGTFTISYYNNSSLNTTNKQVVSMFEAQGSKVYERTFNVNQGYNLLRIAMPQLSAGNYYIVLRDGSGKQIGVANMLIAH